MGSSRPRTKDFFAVPTLSLSLAGAFGRNDAPAATSGDQVEEGDEGDAGTRNLRDDVEISSDNTGPGPGSQSGDGEEEEEGHGDGGKRRKKRSTQSYHRHTVEQVRVMEAVFKESPHPDEMQRQQLSEQLGLSPRQVKFWFQNRRTQIKAIQERHENSLLKSELENLQRENHAMRELTRRTSSRCPNCGIVAASSHEADAAAANQEQELQLENARLRAEIEKLRRKLGKAAVDVAVSPASPPFSVDTIRTNDSRSPFEVYCSGITGHVKKSIFELAGRAMEELKTMCSSGEPLWVRSVETGRDILNYDEYVRLFRRDDGDAGDQPAVWSVEASRESGVIYLDTTQLVHAFMDVNKWKELFPPMIAKASTLSVIRTGREDDGHDGAVQLMFAEVQMLTPMVPTREFCFARYCKKLAAEKWAIVDVSFDKAGGDVHASPSVRCWKNPSGCIIEEQTNGHSRVTWVEHIKCRESAAPSMYRTVAASGLAFGARRWVATLQLQCERMVFSVATNVPTRDSSGVSTLAGRRSVLKLANRMTSSLCRVMGGSRDLACIRAPRVVGSGDLRLTSRRNAGDPGEPQGLIACAVLSTWLPVSPTALLEFLRDESRRTEWDVKLRGRSVQTRVNVAKGKDRRNCVTAYAPTSAEEQGGGGGGGGKWIVQDVCTNSCESIVAYAPVDAATLQPVIGGHDSSGVAVLPCGFAVMPDGLESRPAVITSRKECGAAGSLVTVAFQVVASSSPVAELSTDSAETVTSLVSCTLRDIREALGCEER